MAHGRAHQPSPRPPWGGQARVLAWTSPGGSGLGFLLLPSLIDLSQPGQLWAGKTSMWTGPKWGKGNKNLFGSDGATEAGSPSSRLCALDVFESLTFLSAELGIRLAVRPEPGVSFGASQCPVNTLLFPFSQSGHFLCLGLGGSQQVDSGNWIVY